MRIRRKSILGIFPVSWVRLQTMKLIPIPTKPGTTIVIILLILYYNYFLFKSVRVLKKMRMTSAGATTDLLLL